MKQNPAYIYSVTWVVHYNIQCMLSLFSRSVKSDSLRPHGLQHTRPVCPSPFPWVCPSSHSSHQWCCPAISSSDALFPFSIFPIIRDFSNELSVRIRWPKSWSFSFIIRPFSEYSGLISLKIGWFDLDVQGTFKSLLQHQCVHVEKKSLKNEHQNIYDMYFQVFILQNFFLF